MLHPPDGCLLRSYRGRLLRVVRSDEEVRDVLIQYHDNNNHAGWGRAVKEILVSFDDVVLIDVTVITCFS